MAQVYTNPNDSQPEPPPSTLPTCIDDLPYWCVWKLEQRDDKPTKVLYSPITGERAKSNDPSTFGDRMQASEALSTRKFSGLGVLIHEALDLCVIDLDHIVDEAHAFDEQAITPEVRQLINDADTYVEWSPSGTGLHLYFAGGLGNYMTRNGGRAICHAEAYSRARFMTYTGRRIAGTPNTFNDYASDLTTVLDRLGFEKRTPAQPPPDQFEWTGSGLTNDQILTVATRAANGAKVRRLLDGDIGDYPSHSEADLGLVSLLSFYTEHDDQLADLWRSSGLYRKKLDRDDYIQRTIKTARKTQQRTYDPNYNSTPKAEGKVTAGGKPLGTNDASETTEDDAIDRETLKIEIRRLTAELETAQDTIKTRESVIERERAMRKGAEARAEKFATQKSKAMQVLRNPELSLGERVTGFALALDLGARLANGEMPGDFGYNVPSIRLAEMTGQSEQTVSRHLRELSQKKKLINKRVVREAVDRVDTDGVVETGTRDRNYIDLEGGTIIDLTERLATYQRPEENDGKKRHGGHRLRCSDHPDAGTVKKWHIECAQCKKVLDQGETSQAPNNPDSDAETSGINLIPEPDVSDTSLSGIKLIPEPTTMHSDTKMTPDTTPDGSARRLTFTKNLDCWDCGQELEPGQKGFCLACAERSKQRAEREERIRRSGTRTCTECGEPTRGPTELYCEAHQRRQDEGQVSA